MVIRDFKKNIVSHRTTLRPNLVIYCHKHLTVIIRFYFMNMSHIRGHEFILVDLTTAKDYFDQALNINPRFAEALPLSVLKKVIKILSIVVGLFLAELAYLQSQEIAGINWGQLQWVSQGTISNLANVTTQQISNNVEGNDHKAAIAMANFGIPLTGSMATGFAVVL
jgi:uncharacterized membrane protein (Fun14 family)